MKQKATSLIIVFLCMVTLAGAVKPIKVKLSEFETKLNEKLKKGYYFGISQPNLERDVAILLAKERAFVHYTLCNNLEIKTLQKHYSKLSQVNNTETMSTKWDKFILVKSEATVNMNRAEDEVWLLSSGEYVVFMEAIPFNEIKNTTPYTLEINYSENLSEVNKEDKFKVGLNYTFDCNAYSELYEQVGNKVNTNFNIKNELQKGATSFTAMDYPLKAWTKKIKALPNQTNRFMASAELGLWNAFLTAYLNQVLQNTEVDGIKSLSESYTKSYEKNGSQEQSFSFEEVGQQNNTVDIVQAKIKNIALTELGLSVNVDMLFVD